MKNLKFLWNNASGSVRLRQILLIFIVMGYVLLGLVSPLLFSFMIDNVIDNAPITNPIVKTLAGWIGGVSFIRGHLWVGSAVLLGVSVLYAVLVFIKGRWNAVISESVSETIRNRLYAHLQMLPYSYHVRAKTGDLIQRSSSDINTIRRFLARELTDMFYAIFTAGIAVTILFTMNVKLAWYSLVSLPLIFGSAFIFFKKMQRNFEKADEAEGEYHTKLQENLSGMRVVRAFHKEQFEIEKTGEANRIFRDLLYKAIRVDAAYWALSDTVCIAQILLVVVAGILMCRRGELSVGNFWVFTSYESMIVFPMRMLGRILSDFGKTTVSIRRIDEVMNEKEEITGVGEKPDMRGDIVFDHVSFRYDDAKADVIEDVSFTIPEGKTAAIIGPTGSGKSSLVHLLTGLYDPTGGEIRIGETPISRMKKSWLRRHVGIVLQEPFLFSRSIRDNIKIAREDATEEEIYDAAKKADVHDVILGFDKGYDTLVGEKGVTLSGGQKQRVAIARTVLNEAPIMIFDDSLSAVDTETDFAIRQSLKKMAGSLTMIIITQRISSAKDADLIIVLEDGKITAKGTHDELIQKDGLYKRVYELQTKGGEEDE
ncbi:MAG: ABC transporter ATP-binding protein [Erysipelotrichales bacterium]|nr:ABC transporter ATP-binding protein [Erysipelotrichales bacterium]